MDTARGAVSKATHVSKAPATRTSDLAQQVRTKPLPSTTRRLRRGGVANVVVMTVAAGIVGTLAIPAYAFAPGQRGSAVRHLRRDGAHEGAGADRRGHRTT
jgi:hypothetical protein